MCLLEFGDWYSTSAWGTKCEGGPKRPQAAELKAVLGKVTALPFPPWWWWRGWGLVKGM